jgi:serine/threonine protein kinase
MKPHERNCRSRARSYPERAMTRLVDTSNLEPGTVLFRRYTVEKRLGEGGVGVVVAANDSILRRRVAIKCLRQNQPQSRSLAIRFLREGRAMAQLESAHTVRVFDARPGALVMEYLRGADLSRLLAERGPLSSRQAVTFVLQACDALSEAHARGIVHRDLKLENLFLARRPGSESGVFIKVLDFGLSKVLAEHRAASDEVTLTDTQCVLGSAEFMSPEQLRSSRDVDERTDIWALGVVLFTLLAGRSPFARRFLAEVRGAVLDGNVPPLSGLCRELPKGLEKVVERCLRVEREERYRSARELAAELLPYAGERRRSIYSYAIDNQDAVALDEQPAPESSIRESDRPSGFAGLMRLFSACGLGKPQASSR